MKKIFIIFTVLIFLTACTVTLFLYKNYRPVSYDSTSFSETDKSYDNPFRGFYHMYGFTLSEDEPSYTTDRIQQYIKSGSLQLMLLQINLKNYSDSALSGNALKQLDNILSEIHMAKRQVILRFLYDWDGIAKQTEPSDISQIMEHMEQLSSIVNRYSDMIFIIQGTFAGNCGEMNGSNYGSHEDNRTLIMRLADVTSPSIYLSVRTPSQLRGILQSRTPVSEDTAYNGSTGSRLGLFNDGISGSVYDLGTYDDTSNADTDEPEDKGTRSEEIAFQNDICRYVPNGGEAVIDNPYNDIENAISDMAAMHITYLNCDHDLNVLNKWKASVYEKDGKAGGTNGYDYISAHLGYRYMINDVSVSDSIINGSGINISFNISNTGFAPAYKKFDSFISFIDENNNEAAVFPASFDNRSINAGDTSKFSVTAYTDKLYEKSYRVYFYMKDPYTSQIIQFANADSDKNYGVFLGTLTVGKASPEKFFAAALRHLQNR